MQRSTAFDELTAELVARLALNDWQARELRAVASTWAGTAIYPPTPRTLRRTQALDTARRLCLAGVEPTTIRQRLQDGFRVSKRTAQRILSAAMAPESIRPVD